MVAGVPRFPVCLLADPAAVDEFKSAGRWSRIDSVGGLESDGRVRVQMQFELEEDACAFALSFAARVELLDPPHLRTEVARRLAQAVARYLDSPSGPAQKA